MKRYLSFVLVIIVLLSSFTSCKVATKKTDIENNTTTSSAISSSTVSETEFNKEQSTDKQKTEEKSTLSTTKKSTAQTVEKTLKIPAYKSSPYVVINNNKPFFTADEATIEDFETYSPLDKLGRCGPAMASIGKKLMPTEKRGAIGAVKPSGWHTIKYDFVDGKYLYNRCHLIGYQLTAENANEKNLITGTRYLNVQGMLPFENMVADYIKETGNHVLYRVTPMFNGNNLVANGVLMEAYSVEDAGYEIEFCVYCYNVQPGVIINYADGTSSLDSNETKTTKSTTQKSTIKSNPVNEDTIKNIQTYVLNKNTKEFHLTTCSDVAKIKKDNKEYVKSLRDSLIDNGYSPCGHCKP